MQPRIVRLLAFAALLFFAATCFAGNKVPKTYPEQGKITAVHTQERSDTDPVYTDPNGKTHGGDSSVTRLPVFSVETDTKIYQLEGRHRTVLPLGGTIHFRIEKDHAFVQQDDKELKLRVVGVELKKAN